LVLIGADDPEGMLRHTQECRDRDYPFAADPSQQLAFSDDPTIRRLIEGATYLFSNEYEAALIQQKTGWSADEILALVGTWVTTLGARGARIERRGEPTVEVGVARELRKADPTGVGDAFRAGFLAGLSFDLSHERCAQLGSMLATYVVETIGTQEYELTRAVFVQRFTEAYGAHAASEVEPHLRIARS
ncbi:MAG: carbohydrate kinase family protein, partial [Rhodoferax sp.]|nr:carbohydrate kinase family protein [Actinomycetota bacterium]